MFLPEGRVSGRTTVLQLLPLLPRRQVEAYNRYTSVLGRLKSVIRVVSVLQSQAFVRYGAPA